MGDEKSVRCREWLGIEPDDLRVPHRVVGVASHEDDPLVIVRAADRRLATLRGIRGGHGPERDDLIARVEASRDALLARAASKAAPPTPPPVPPAVPPPIVIHQSSRRRRGRSAAASLSITGLAIVASALVVYMAWPKLERRARQTARAGLAATGVASDSRNDVTDVESPRSIDRVVTQSSPKPRPQPEAVRIAPPSPPPPEPAEESPLSKLPVATAIASPTTTTTTTTTATTPTTTDAPVLTGPTIDEAITRAATALRAGDHSVAKRILADILDAASADEAATDRVQRWLLLADYAGQYPECRDKALRSAADAAAVYDLDDFQIAVIEFTPKVFAYRDSRKPGRNLRVAATKIPADIERGLIETWFSNDDRAANHLILGAAALATKRPDVAKARQEFQAAVDMGEPQGTMLLAILEDPALGDR